MSLNRSKVEIYVNKYWYTPCDDGIIHSYVKGNVNVETERVQLQRQGKLPGKGWDAVLLPQLDGNRQPISGKEMGCFIRGNPNGQEITAEIKPPQLTGTFDVVPFYEVAGEHDGLVDCAHYVSRCLTAGGVAVNHPGVSGLVQELRSRRDTYTLGLEITRERGERILDTGVMKFGDVIAYVHEDPKTHKMGYSHSAVYTGVDEIGVHRLSCHTTARFNQFFNNTPWNITVHPDWRFTLIHFAEETDVFPPLSQPLRFEVSQGGTSEVYEFKSQGHVARARNPVSAHPSFGVRPEDRGYWFTRDRTLFVFWPRTGQVAEATFVSFDKIGDFPLTLDGLPATVRAV